MPHPATTTTIALAAATILVALAHEATDAASPHVHRGHAPHQHEAPDTFAVTATASGPTVQQLAAARATVAAAAAAYGTLQTATPPSARDRALRILRRVAIPALTRDLAARAPRPWSGQTGAWRAAAVDALAEQSYEPRAIAVTVDYRRGPHKLLATFLVDATHRLPVVTDVDGLIGSAT
jgi:hypothetical protein